jgi:hypothetical protein
LLKQYLLVEIVFVHSMVQLLSKTTRLSALATTEHQQVTTVPVEQLDNALAHLTQMQSMQKVTTTYAGQLTQNQTHFCVLLGQS